VSGPYVEQTGEPGEAATDDDLREFARAACRWFHDVRVGRQPCASCSRFATLDLAALVAAAEERGRVEGAERCAEEMRAAFASTAFRDEDWHDGEVAAILRDLAERWSSS